MLGLSLGSIGVDNSKELLVIYICKLLSKKKHFNMLKGQKGQALLIIVLVMVVALTVGLSVASRTITNLRNTREQASSQKALSAAEAGIEQAIKSGAPVAGRLAGNTTYNTTVAQVNGTTPFVLNGGASVAKNDAIYVWVTPYSTNPANLWQPPWAPGGGELTIYWGDNTGDCNNGAIEISVISGSKDLPIITRYTADPCAARRGVNNFGNVATSNTTISGIRFYYKKTITITNGLLVRVDSVYKATFMGASGSVALPGQGSIITSTGTSDDTTQRKVTVFQGYPEIPAEFFPYILFQP